MARWIKIALAVGVVAVAAVGMVAFRSAHPEPATGHHLKVIPAGSFLVWSEVDPGTYRATGVDGCHWSRSSSLDPLSGETVERGEVASGAPASVTIDGDDARFSSDGCTAWTRD